MPSVVKEQLRLVVPVVMYRVLDSVDDVCMVSARVGLSCGMGV